MHTNGIALRKLTPEEEQEVTRLYVAGMPGVDDIAKQFGVASSTVGRIAKRHGAPPRAGTTTHRRRPGQAAAAAPAPRPSTGSPMVRRMLAMQACLATTAAELAAAKLANDADAELVVDLAQHMRLTVDLLMGRDPALRSRLV